MVDALAFFSLFLIEGVNDGQFGEGNGVFFPHKLAIENVQFYSKKKYFRRND